MVRFLICVWSLLFFGGIARPAHAQIYSGTTASGSILLSTQAEDGAQEVLVPADPAPVLAPAQPGPPGAPVRIPSSYAGYVHEAAVTYHLPEPLIHAVISVESNYNALAVSRKGAQGLMQLMPATARRFGNHNMFDARQNILTGSRYLRWLLDFFDQNLELSVAAYNAGEQAVVQAGRRIPPIPETLRYVPRVMGIYQRLARPG